MPRARSTCTLFCQVRATWKLGSIVEIDCVGSVNPGGAFDRLFGNAGAPVAPGPTDAVNSLGDPLNCSAFSYAIRIGWSYINPVLARTTVRGSSVHATPPRGPKLFLSMLNFCEYEKGESARASGYLYRS